MMVDCWVAWTMVSDGFDSECASFSNSWFEVAPFWESVKRYREYVLELNT